MGGLRSHDLGEPSTFSPYPLLELRQYEAHIQQPTVWHDTLPTGEIAESLIRAFSLFSNLNYILSVAEIAKGYKTACMSAVLGSTSIHTLNRVKYRGTMTLY